MFVTCIDVDIRHTVDIGHLLSQRKDVVVHDNDNNVVMMLSNLLYCLLLFVLNDTAIAYEPDSMLDCVEAKNMR